jgi:hypothetical protein
MESEDGTVALGVEALLGQEEAVLKALSRPLDRVTGLRGGHHPRQRAPGVHPRRSRLLA